MVSVALTAEVSVPPVLVGPPVSLSEALSEPASPVVGTVESVTALPVVPVVPVVVVVESPVLVCESLALVLPSSPQATGTRRSRDRSRGEATRAVSRTPRPGVKVGEMMSHSWNMSEQTCESGPDITGAGLAGRRAVGSVDRALPPSRPASDMSLRTCR